ncbi:MAG TPA: hypothetical protein VGY48_33810 [Vicinamibacterales bacterium]|nr:hypothetical protein [Vicinamibacterales bacterium]
MSSRLVAGASTLAAFAALSAAAADPAGQARGFASGGSGTSTSRIASPTVVASWSSHENYADGSSTTLLVLWRGTPGWFSKDGRSGGSGGGSGGAAGGGGGGAASGAGLSGSYAYEYVFQGGLTFMMEFDYAKKIVKILDQEISLAETNVVLVDFVDSPGGPQIVGTRWIDAAPRIDSAPPQQPAPTPTGISFGPVDPIGAVVKRAPELFEYLRCDLSLSDPVMKTMMPIICGQMHP